MNNLLILDGDPILKNGFYFAGCHNAHWPECVFGHTIVKFSMDGIRLNHKNYRKYVFCGRRFAGKCGMLPQEQMGRNYG